MRVRAARRAATHALAALIALLAFFSRPLAADDNVDKLRALRARIENLQQRLDANLSARDHVRSQLRDSEREVGEVLRKLHRLDRELGVAAQRLADVRRETGERRARLRGELDRLGRDLRAAQILGQQDYLKLWLSQEDPARLARMLVYYRYLAAARAQAIERVRNDLVQLQAAEQRVDQRRRELAGLRATQIQAQTRLVQARRERAAALAQLDRTIEDHSQEIERLRREEQGLTEVIDGLRRLAPLPDVTIGPQARFAQFKGRLASPVAVSARSGQPVAGRKGLILPVPAGQPVRAVFRGRVAYADWLPGFGLLLILEHDNGYMTLYGYNQSLYKNVGDWVDAGQVIATSGNTGGTHRPGLYFEVRHNGEARNPLNWLRR